ncbi:MAG: efflux RND transporter periplasmic adaptor subunit [Gammaproteobacteria bacterium]|nr:efflux RND transporter periplasmic adaptor subunit [Gammaproteobacteria bacterium]NIR84979.1 efflux RND transporter periplasmic adaptor subunit [Gammaproteobacteria bacterium]NIR91828.1 efflux RND transporter periplasmic adaptor subunit [Gammaproteobacteria bacterium]NIU06026.1 efflux RND transporter periplasmic adaptor subunit [Gammaproteobacteria bacterium]NIV53073.1 efflux RND transporter periplasmic adaptor subunit [Gammaproteobacteria bacterium]
MPELDCLMEPHVVVDVSTESEGILENLEVDRGDVVKEGQVLATLEADVEKATVELARARAESTAEVNAKQVSLAYGKRRQKRFSELYANDAVPELEKDEAETEATLAALKLREATEKRRLAELELRRALAALKRRTIRSPVTGVVVERLAGPGESVEDQAVLRVAQLDPLNVEVIVPVSLYGTIKEGTPALVMPEAPVGGNYRAIVTIVDRVLDAPSGTFGVRLELPNPNHSLPGGLKCRVRFLPPRQGSGDDTAS